MMQLRAMMSVSLRVLLSRHDDVPCGVMSHMQGCDVTPGDEVSPWEGLSQGDAVRQGGRAPALGGAH